MGDLVPMTKKFNGKTYHQWTISSTVRTKMTNFAAKLRKHGYAARVVNIFGTYFVYTSPKQRISDKL